MSHSNNELRVFYPRIFPYVSDRCQRFPTLHVSKYCSFPGFMIEMISILAKENNLTIVPVINIIDDHDKNWNLITKSMLLNETFDLVAISWQMTNERFKDFDFSISLYEAQTRLIKLTRNSQFQQMFSFFHSYDTNVWLAVIFAWLLQWICFSLIQRLDAHYSGKNKISSFECAWHVLRLQLLQYQDPKHKPNASARFSMSIFLFFQCYVLLGLFSSFILASVLRPFLDNDDPLNLLIDGVKNKQYTLAALSHPGWMIETINESFYFPYSDIREALKVNPLKTVNSNFELFQLLMKGQTLAIQQSDDYNYYKLQQYCDLVALDYRMPTVDSRLMMKKGHPLMDKLNQAIRLNKNKFAQIIQKYLKYADQLSECPSRGKFKPLQISPFLGATVICSVFLFIAIILLFVEKIYWKINTRTNTD